MFSSIDDKSVAIGAVLGFIVVPRLVSAINSRKSNPAA